MKNEDDYAITLFIRWIVFYTEIGFIHIFHHSATISE